MKIAIMQPYIFPYIGYFQLINLVDKFVLYDDVNYINKGWINRNNILINGKASLFTIPLKGASQNKRINEIFLGDDKKWKAKFLQTIYINYKKTPHFENVFHLLEKIISSEYEKINELVFNSIIEINAYLSINTFIQKTSNIYSNQHLKGPERILDICKKEFATNYINPIGGQPLYDNLIFQNNGVELNFIKSLSLEYKQFKNEFIPWLSIIDLLMFNSISEVKLFLSKYELV
jgi:ribosomal protein S8E